MGESPTFYNALTREPSPYQGTFYNPGEALYQALITNNNRTRSTPKYKTYQPTKPPTRVKSWAGHSKPNTRHQSNSNTFIPKPLRQVYAEYLRNYAEYIRQYNLYRNKYITNLRNALQDVRDGMRIRRIANELVRSSGPARNEHRNLCARLLNRKIKTTSLHPPFGEFESLLLSSCQT